MQNNPFIHGPPVPPDKFIDREREVDIILDRLANPKNRGGSTVSGPSGIGKTSLIHYLCAEGTRGPWAELHPDLAHFVYIPLGFISPFSELGFWEYLFDELVDWLGSTAETETIMKAIEAGQSPSRHSVRKFFENLGSEKNKLAVVLLDGFDLLMSDIREDDSRAGLAFLQRLRALLNLPAPRGFSLITSSERDLFDLFENVHWFGSDFCSNMASLPLSPFSDTQIDELIDEYLLGTDIEFNEDDRRHLKETSVGHPKALQQAAYHMFETKDQGMKAKQENEGIPAELTVKVDFDSFDAFLCHNSEDKPAVKEIGKQLRERGISPWLDEWELRPGLPWQRLLEEQIEQINSAAVFIGRSGIGPWQQMELEAFLREFVIRGCPVIPVLLSDASKVPELPVFLRGMTWVDFRKSDPNPMKQLIWGITGKAPQGSL